MKLIARIVTFLWSIVLVLELLIAIFIPSLYNSIIEGLLDGLGDYNKQLKKDEKKK